ncbi:hypothetical protein [Frankia sp. AiPa1]|uniref:hypothetical protein n=1 Tax=Frankia sp. AiPa1 TaxID=573492 RepID=UPI00202B22EB|nr:hypothetical protein [Frankia sp. AiPa1]MCL9757901.1 hypothetical protein [Frankia sp. AiPa1]
MGRRAAALAISGAASIAFTLGGAGTAHAFDDKDSHGGRDNCASRDGKDDKDDWDIFGDKNKDDHGKDDHGKDDHGKDDHGKDGRDGVDGKDDRDDRGLGDKADGDRKAQADNLGDKDDKDGDWFNWDDKDKDRDKDRDCVAGVGVVAGAGVGVGVGGGGVAAGGGGMADRATSSDVLPIAGAAIGVLMIAAGAGRRRSQGAG